MAASCRLLGLVADEVRLPDGALVGDVSPKGLRIGGTMRATADQQRSARLFVPEWKIACENGAVADVWMTKLRVNGELMRRELWHLRLRPAAQGPLRYLAAAAPWMCHSLHHAD